MQYENVIKIIKSKINSTKLSKILMHSKLKTQDNVHLIYLNSDKVFGTVSLKIQLIMSSLLFIIIFICSLMLNS